MREKYYHFKIKNIVKIQDIVTLYSFYHQKGYVSYPEKHDFCEFNYCPNGSFDVEINGKEYHLKEGEILFIKPGETHSLKTKFQDNNVLIAAFSSKSTSMGYLNNRVLKVSEQILPLLRLLFKIGGQYFDVEVPNPNKKMYVRDGAPIGGLQSIKNLLELFIIELLKQEKFENVPISLSYNQMVTRIIKILQNSVFDNLTMDDIANKIGYSKSYIHRVFYKETNETIRTFYLRAKIEQAKKMIILNVLNIAEISNKLAFDTPNYFCKVFKKYVGKSPSEYKKSLNRIV